MFFQVLGEFFETNISTLSLRGDNRLQNASGFSFYPVLFVYSGNGLVHLKNYTKHINESQTTK